MPSAAQVALSLPRAISAWWDTWARTTCPVLHREFLQSFPQLCELMLPSPRVGATRPSETSPDGGDTCFLVMALAVMRRTGQVVWSGSRAEFVCCSLHTLDGGLDFGFLGRQHGGDMPFLSHRIRASVVSMSNHWLF